LENYGFRVVIAPSFADIFYNNCFKNGVLPILDDFRRHCLLNGLDDIALTLQHEDKITAYEERHGLTSPTISA
jgi:3-isopropylmalate/(R)-2-methylmalate dehydratase small subunit